MNRYTIPCTPGQTKRALKLGAPIDSSTVYFEGFDMIDHNEDYSSKVYAIIPTAEEMIGWLEEQKIYFSINCIGDYVYEVWIKDNNNNSKVIINSCVPSRKEATLAAIDAALEYLSNNKK